MSSLEHEPNNPEHYLNLAKIQMLTGNRSGALRALREGVVLGGSAELLEKLNEFGRRKSPVIPFLPRSNSLNKFLGLFLYRIGLRR